MEALQESKQSSFSTEAWRPLPATPSAEPGPLKGLWSPLTGIFLVLWFWFMLVDRSAFFGDPSVFWHIVVGQEILDTGRFPQTDHFSFTFAGQRWIARQWLAECALALFHRMSGFDGVLLGTATLLAAFITWLAHRLMRAGIHWLLASLLILFAFRASFYHFYPRPHLVTIVLLGWVFGLLCDYEERRIRLCSLFWLAPVFVVWANAHDGALGGLGTLGLTAGGWAAAQIAGLEAPQKGMRQFLILGCILLCCGLAILVNPYGLESPLTTLRLMQSRVVHQIMLEHLSLMENPVRWKVLLFGALYLAALVGVLPRRPRVAWLVPLVWLYLAWTRVRHGPLFAVTATVALADILPHVRWLAWLAARGNDLFRIAQAPNALDLAGQRWKPWLIPCALVLTAFGCQLMALPVPLLGRGWAGPDEVRWPLELLPDLREFEGTHPRGTPIFNEMVFGGFLIYCTPGLKVFTDDRCELYGDEHLLASSGAFVNPGQIEAWTHQYDLEIALTIPGSSIDQSFRNAESWRPVRQARNANLYRRKTARE